MRLMLSCLKVDISNAELFELRQRHGDHIPERYAIRTNGEVKASEIMESRVLPAVTNAGPDPITGLYVKKIELRAIDKTSWDALVFYARAN